jgi:hypothetical protein
MTTTEPTPNTSEEVHQILKAFGAEVAVMQAILRREFSLPESDYRTFAKLNLKFATSVDRVLEIVEAIGLATLPEFTEPIANLRRLRTQLANAPALGALARESWWVRLKRLAGRPLAILFGRRAERPEPQLSGAQLRVLAERRPPPQEWYEADMEKPF